MELWFFHTKVGGLDPAAALSVFRCLRVCVQRDGEEGAGSGLSYP